jgi:hypothetical protein
MKKILLKLVVIAVMTLLLSEFLLRFIFGFGTPALYDESESYEYLYKPHQNIERFNNTLTTNKYGMRNKEVSEHSIKILKLGDSIINGGSQTDNDELSSTILSAEISRVMKKRHQVLNISAGSWGPDNAYAFLQEYGDFGAKLAVLVYSSHDYSDYMNFKKTVGVNPSYPDKNPQSAISEVFSRYLFPASTKEHELTKISNLVNQKTGLNKGFPNLVRWLEDRNIKIIAYIHPEVQEVQKKKYKDSGKEIISFWSQHNIQVIHGLDHLDETCYRDGIHLNPKGQKKMADSMLPVILKTINKPD